MIGWLSEMHNDKRSATSAGDRRHAPLTASSARSWHPVAMRDRSARPPMTGAWSARQCDTSNRCSRGVAAQAVVMATSSNSVEERSNSTSCGWPKMSGALSPEHPAASRQLRADRPPPRRLNCENASSRSSKHSETLIRDSRAPVIAGTRSEVQRHRLRSSKTGDARQRCATAASSSFSHM
eukprot:scaffold28477_cov112-Isochrysis_galbana.AAC.3